MLHVEERSDPSECRCAECRAIEAAIVEIAERAHRRRVAHAAGGEVEP